jgi:nitrate/TMAO reductase-like tetraheme cytochrome c subunit
MKKTNASRSMAPVQGFAAGRGRPFAFGAPHDFHAILREALTNRGGSLNRLRAWFHAGRERVRAWPRPVAAGALVGASVLLVGAAYGAGRSYSYVMNDPRFCRSCHTMEQAWDRWQTSEHRKVDCHSCHEASIVESARQVITFVVRQPERVGRHAVVPREVCARCHESGDARWRQVEETAGHKVHAGQRNIQCVVCHAPSIHRFRPPTAVCGSCHVAQTRGERTIKIRAMADQHCIDCHQFLRLDSPLRPSRQTCLDCHRLIPSQVGMFPANAPMQFPCAQCHRPHEAARPVVACASCHEKPRADLHPAEMLKTTPCTTCHVPHRWKVTP